MPTNIYVTNIQIYINCTYKYAYLSCELLVHSQNVLTFQTRNFHMKFTPNTFCLQRVRAENTSKISNNNNTNKRQNVAKRYQH